MTTRYEANLKGCPFTFNGPQDKNCISDGCMAWRWHNTADKERERINIPRDTPVGKVLDLCPPGWIVIPADLERVSKWLSPGQSFWVERDWTEAREGFCGLCEPRIAEIEQ